MVGKHIENLNNREEREKKGYGIIWYNAHIVIASMYVTIVTFLTEKSPMGCVMPNRVGNSLEHVKRR